MKISSVLISLLVISHATAQAQNIEIFINNNPNPPIPDPNGSKVAPYPNFEQAFQNNITSNINSSSIQLFFFPTEEAYVLTLFTSCVKCNLSFSSYTPSQDASNCNSLPILNFQGAVAFMGPNATINFESVQLYLTGQSVSTRFVGSYLQMNFLGVCMNVTNPENEVDFIIQTEEQEIAFSNSAFSSALAL